MNKIKRMFSVGVSLFNIINNDELIFRKYKKRNMKW